MARKNTYGYYAPSTNKYGRAFLIPGEGPYYGGRRGGDPLISVWNMYGLNYPPPVPTNFTVENYPSISDSSPVYMWDATPVAEDTLQFQIQINYLTNDFTSPTTTLGWFTATPLIGDLEWSYETPIESRLLMEGTYYARIRSTDGFTTSAWSDVIEFSFLLSPPPPPTIDTVTSPTDQFVQVIRGSKTPGTHVYIRNNQGDWHEVSYDNGIIGNRWYYTLTLDSQDNVIEAIANWSKSTILGISTTVYAFIHAIFSEPEPYNVWNCFDELGMIVGLDRMKGEKNKSYKKRIKDVYQNPGNSTHDGLVNSIARELGIDASGVRVLRLSDLSDPTSSSNILNSDGNAIGTKLEDYVSEVYSHNPIFWGNLVSDESVWDCVNEEYTGVSYLPHLWDPSSSGIYDKWQKTGIGDHDDLFVGDVEKSIDTTKGIYGPSTGNGMMVASGVLVDDISWKIPVHSGYFYIKGEDVITPEAPWPTDPEFVLGVNLPGGFSGAYWKYGYNIGEGTLGGPAGQLGWHGDAFSSPAMYASTQTRMSRFAGYIVRVFLFGDLRSGIVFSPEPSGSTYAATNGTPVGFTDYVYDDMDALIDIAKENNVRLMPVLLDYLMADGVTSQGGTQVGEYPACITDATKREALIDLMGDFVHHYKDESTIYAWDVYNEPCISVKLGIITKSQMQTFISDLCVKVRERDPNHHVTVGSWTRYFMKEDVSNSELGLMDDNGQDIYTFHYYNDMETGYPPIQPATPLDYPADSIGLDKKIIISECQPNADGDNPLTAIEKLELTYANGYDGFFLWQDETFTITNADKIAIDAWKAAH